ncbi:MAG TPA: 4'-phosphopantetheinyl transferase superfamily protein [Bellilinea sp.]|nr:4'-phosphopantetheinyl transferase superfamily protein [Bellilinea sp.]
MTDADVIYWYMDEADPEGVGLIGTNTPDWLSLEERTRFDSMRFPKRRREWLLGRLTAKILLTRCLPELATVPMDCITIGNHAEGAPFVSITGDPMPIKLSISHREGMAVAAVSVNPGVSLGIDLEWVEDHPQSFYKDFFTPGEVELMAGMPTDRHGWVGTLIWSAKEAVLKAMGKGLRLDTRSVDITGIGRTTVDGWGKYDMRIANSHEKDWHTVWREPGPYLLTLAVRNSKTTPIIRQIG